MANSKAKTQQPQQQKTAQEELTPVQQASQLILDTKEQINFILRDPAYVHNLLFINAALNNLITKLSFIGGITMGKEKKHVFPPITSFMGEKIVRAKMVSADDLNPETAERKQYIARVDKLQRDIHGIATENIIKAFTIGDDEAVLRGVAKRAGLPNYADGVINSEFVNQIKSSLLEQNDRKHLQDKIDEALEGMEDKVKTEAEFFDHTITQEDIDANPELIEQGVKVGDVVQVPVKETDAEAKLLNLSTLNSKPIEEPLTNNSAEDPKATSGKGTGKSSNQKGANN